METASSTLVGADALIIVPEWKEFKSSDFGQILKLLRHPVIFDGRNLYEPALVASFGIHYEAMCRSPPKVSQANAT